MEDRLGIDTTALAALQALGGGQGIDLGQLAALGAASGNADFPPGVTAEVKLLSIQMQVDKCDAKLSNKTKNILPKTKTRMRWRL